MENAEIYTPPLNMSMFSMFSPEDVSTQLFDLVDKKTSSMPDLGRVIIVGYSAGAPIARRLFCKAYGAQKDGSLDEKSVRAWAHKIERLVIVAGITRG